MCGHGVARSRRPKNPCYGNGMNLLEPLRLLPDQELVSALDDLARRDRRTGAEIVAHLVIVAERRIHLDLAYSSLVEYCVDRLGCSLDVAYKRAAAVKVSQARPEVLDWLAEGAMTLSGLAVLAPHRDDADLVREARGKSKREIQKLVAARHPDRDWSRLQTRVRPVAEGVCKIEMTVPQELLAQVEQALDLDSHIDPSRDVPRLLGRALDCYIDKRRRRRCADTDRPRPASEEAVSEQPSSQQSTRRVPAAGRRTAYRASGGQCEYVSPQGKRCSARAFLEIDHVVPRARGGGHDKLRVLCRFHNQRAAERELGTAHMEEARRRAAAHRDVTTALAGLGFRPGLARQAAEGAVADLGPAAELDVLIKSALRLAAPASAGISPS